MLTLALLNLAYGGLPDDELTLQTDQLVVGLHADGTLINQAAGVGLIWDPDGPDGTTPVGGDWLLAGRAFEVWTLSATAGGEALTWTNTGRPEGSALTLDWAIAAEGPDAFALYGAGGDETLEVEQWVVVWPDQDVVGLLLVVHALVDLSDLSVVRVVDPDPDYGFDGTSHSLNEGGDGVASATGAWDGRTLALASPGGVGAICAWCESPADLMAGSTEPETSEAQIGVAVDLGDLAAGDSLTVAFAYALDLDAEAARASAVASAQALSEDLDGDGSSAADGDCDEGSAGVSPGASQQYNGEDDDCDGTIDEDSVGSDDDGDGFAEADGDCDDGDAAVFPGAEDTDNDCVGDDDALAELSDGEEEVGACSGAPLTPTRELLAWSVIGLALVWRRR